MSGQLVGYVRVSSTSQNQARQLEAVGEVEELFTDEITGSSRTGRKGLEAMLRHVRRGDVVRVASMDRLARSLMDLEQLVGELTGRGIRVEFVKERLTFSPGSDDPFATFQRQLIGAVAELERSLIRERQREGIELAKKRGVYKGRVRKLTDDQVQYVRHAVAAGETKAEVARNLGCSVRVIYKVLAAEAPYGCAEPSDGGRSGLVGAEEIELPLPQ